MNIATFNVNDINKRLSNLLEWLDASRPDVVCLQAIKTTDAGFPIDAIEAAGYSAVCRGERAWNGVAILARSTEPVLIRNTLPGDLDDPQSRYIEAAVNGVVISSLYLPNGNPQPGPKFDYKLDWFDRLLNHAAGLLHDDVPVVLAGDYNVVPTEFDIYSVKSFADNALLQPAPRVAYAQLIDMGWTDALRHRHPISRCSHSGVICATGGHATPGYALTICCSVPPSRPGLRMPVWIGTSEVNRTRAIMPRRGLNSPAAQLGAVRRRRKVGQRPLPARRDSVKPAAVRRLNAADLP